ncbi:CsbD family protein [Kitasatospora sp. NBC_01250]|uniref:CsbD family protein n=1 Tax=unclassified Kitasatospora TaxID=2633591 RepID=UPI002E160231|nr:MULTISPECIES: CsbD family protein [unclassified Kitasatospora]WSJ66738.1 CsbD family protein [Kitasatospora sp. NBC_01302]
MSAGDTIENTADKAMGAIKEGVGKATGNERLQAQGKADQIKGDLKQVGEHVKDAFGH